VFKKKFMQLNRVISDEGFNISYGHRSVYYTDERGRFEFPFEDGLLIPKPYQISGEHIFLSLPEIEEMTERVAAGIKYDGRPFEIFRTTES
jgi:hypothetical protein